MPYGHRKTTLSILILLLALAFPAMAEDPGFAAPPSAELPMPDAHSAEPADDAVHGAAHADDAHADGDAHGKKGGLPQFDPTSFPSQIFWLAITLAFLYLFFSRKTLPDIGGIIDRRDGHIRDHLDRAKQQKDGAEKLKQDYEAEIERARQEATSAFTTAERLIKEKGESQQKSFQEKAEKTLAGLDADIARAKGAAMEDMHALAAEIASKAAEKIIGVETDIDQAKTVVQALKAKAA